MCGQCVEKTWGKEGVKEGGRRRGLSWVGGWVGGGVSILQRVVPWMVWREMRFAHRGGAWGGREGGKDSLRPGSMKAFHATSAGAGPAPGPGYGGEGGDEGAHG